MRALYRVMRQCVGTLSSPFHRALGADWGASFNSNSPLHGKGAEKALQWFLQQYAWRQSVQVWSSTVTSP